MNKRSRRNIVGQLSRQDFPVLKQPRKPRILLNRAKLPFDFFQAAPRKSFFDRLREADQLLCESRGNSHDKIGRNTGRQGRSCELERRKGSMLESGRASEQHSASSRKERLQSRYAPLFPQIGCKGRQTPSFYKE